MANKIPLSVIGVVSSVLAEYFYSHSKLNSLFLESGAPGADPGGNCEAKCQRWLMRCNDEPTVDALAVFGRVIQRFMDQEPSDQLQAVSDGQKRIRDSLAINQLSYQLNGFIILAGSSPAAKTLTDYLKVGDFASIEVEFERAVSHISQDPHAAITAASSIIEALCKTDIDKVGLEMPNKQTAIPLWRVVQQHLGLNLDPTLREDQKKILQGLASIIDGVAAYRTHIGSAHGRGLRPPEIVASEARLAVNAAHTLVIFIMEKWQGVMPHT
ncbi:abortive infection family protein [candidate division CSSED10-310 bacterium]|uniref:Abortive infection family protein n=1 Tax=candidate division CSSED10-310 bacterium TaxID=2855610 RepID=A0ABV6Z317_UNCC1